MHFACVSIFKRVQPMTATFLLLKKAYKPRYYSRSCVMLRNKPRNHTNSVTSTLSTGANDHMHSSSFANHDGVNDKSIVDDLQSIQDVYRYAVTLFNKHELSYGHTTDNAYQDASFLIMHELHLPFLDPISQWSTSRLTRQERVHLLNLITQRVKTRIPTAYLVKGCYQQGEYFHIDERVIIPRSYLGEIMFSKSINVVGSNSGGVSTNGDNISGFSHYSIVSSSPSPYRDMDYEDYFEGEKHSSGDDDSETVEDKLDDLYGRKKTHYLINTDNVHSVLDLCTGSGCLAVLAAKAFPLAQEIDAVDISTDALEVASANIELHGLDDVITLYHGDLYAPLHGRADDDTVNHTKYDLIISNPPYVSEDRMDDLPAEYTHEPRLALTGGMDGLDLIRGVLLGAYNHLNDGGGLLCEIGQCKDDLERAFPKLFGSKFYSNRDIEMLKSEKRHRFHHDSNATSECKVHWINTAHSSGEVFYVEKRFLQDEYLSM